MKNLFNKYIGNPGVSWTNKDDVIAAVKKDGQRLQYADSGLRDDFDVVIVAVTQDPDALQYASRGLRSNKEIGFAAACEGERRNIAYINDDLLQDRGFAMELAQYSSFISKYFKDDKEIVLTVMSRGVSFITFNSAGSKVRSDKDFMLKIIEENPLCFQYASEALRDDEEVAIAAIKGWSHQFEFASKRIQNNPKIQKIFLEVEFELMGGNKQTAELKLQRILANKNINTGKDLYR